MAKLYAELTSDKSKRVMSKSGNDRIEILLRIKNEPHSIITLLPSGNLIIDKLSKDCDIIET